MICKACGADLTQERTVVVYGARKPLNTMYCTSCHRLWPIPENSTKVFYVQCPGHGEPKHAHKDVASAVAEAERICVLNKQPVRVYQQIAVVNPVIKTEVKYG